ncbi:MAG TPA: hypothetical protein VGE64_01710 [Xanthomonadaceae bacterium]
MRIAFDLDGTLVPMFAGQFPVEPVAWPMRAFAADPLRLQTIQLFRLLKARKHELWIYTSSLRQPFAIRRTLWAHGLRIDGVINADLHAEASGARVASKYPPAFGIDLLIDDAPGVEVEGRQHGFAVLRIDPGDADWSLKVLDAIP